MNKLEDLPASPQELPEWVVECLSRLFSSISDHTRIRIVHALTEADRLNVSEIAEYTSLSISAISHQLRLLASATSFPPTRLLHIQIDLCVKVVEKEIHCCRTR